MGYINYVLVYVGDRNRPMRAVGPFDTRDEAKLHQAPNSTIVELLEPVRGREKKVGKHG